MDKLKSYPIAPIAISKTITIPGDKSISHRSLMIGSQAVGAPIEITGLLEGEDVIATANAMRAMGVEVFQDGDKWIVHGCGVGGLQAPTVPLDMGNSGTSTRLLMGLVAPYDFITELTGDASLSKRPMQRCIRPLTNMGAHVESMEGGRLPLKIHGNRLMAPISYRLPVASAQVKSCVLLAGLNIPGKITVIEQTLTRDHTENMLRYFGADIDISDREDGRYITITGQPELRAKNINVPSDPSSAAFFVVMALIHKNIELTLPNIALSETRNGLYITLKEMGADIKYLNKREEAGEKVADLIVRSSQLNGITVPASRAASMIDEYPILSIAASFAKGTTRMEGLEELKVKESDRLQAVADGLVANGVPHRLGEDWLEIYGSETVKGGGEVKTHLDHRIAMSFLVLGSRSDNPVAIDDGSKIATSFPNFLELFEGLGGNIE